VVAAALQLVLLVVVVVVVAAIAILAATPYAPMATITLSTSRLPDASRMERTERRGGESMENVVPPSEQGVTSEINSDYFPLSR
jgi:hypothetical protein